MDDIFLYLCPDKGDPVSYVKLKAKDYMEPNPQLQWLEMSAEPTQDRV